MRAHDVARNHPFLQQMGDGEALPSSARRIGERQGKTGAAGTRAAQTNYFQRAHSAGGAMESYLVTWKIDIEADTPEQAALAALAIQRKPASIAVVFTVRGKATGVTTLIDLERDDACDSCNRRGWDIFNADPAIGDLGEIQRCDDCKKLRDDSVACHDARVAGFAVDNECCILEPSVDDLAAARRWRETEDRVLTYFASYSGGVPPDDCHS
jgi:hypothetical protein